MLQVGLTVDFAASAGDATGSFAWLGVQAVTYRTGHNYRRIIISSDW